MLHIHRNGNTHTDSLATLATSLTQDLPQVILVEDLCKPAVVKKDMVQIHQIKVRSSWMDPIVLILKEDILPEQMSKAKKVRRKAPRFWLSEDKKLYKRSFSGLYLLCIQPETSELLFEKLHEGIYGSHARGKCLSHLALIGILGARHGKESTRICEEV